MLVGLRCICEQASETILIEVNNLGNNSPPSADKMRGVKGISFLQKNNANFISFYTKF